MKSHYNPPPNTKKQSTLRGVIAQEAFHGYQQWCVNNELYVMAVIINYDTPTAYTMGYKENHRVDLTKDSTPDKPTYMGIKMFKT